MGTSNLLLRLMKALNHCQLLKADSSIGGYSALEIEPMHWQTVAQMIQQDQGRFAGLWAEELEDVFFVTVCFCIEKHYLLMRTSLNKKIPLKLSSLSCLYLAANRFERHTHDLFGIEFIDTDDSRRWTRHQAWQANQFPLRKDFPAAGYGTGKTPADKTYPFLQATGEGVCEVPVGPIHAGIIEPGHFRFQIAGEEVLYLEERLGYVHKGIEKIAEGKDIHHLINLAAHVSGDCTLSYAGSTCMAVENALQITVPDRALFIRAILAERERIANHLWDVAAICNDVGFAFAYYQFGRLRELWLRTNAYLFGHRLLMNCLSVGGVQKDYLSATAIDLLQHELVPLEKEVGELTHILDTNASLQNRLRTTGVLSHETAQAVGALGYVSKASGIDFDVRRDAPYAPYHQCEVSSPVLSDGDVAARLSIRLKEIKSALTLIKDLLNTLPSGPYQTTWTHPPYPTAGIGIVESWRGELLTYVSLDATGKVSRYFPRDPSWFNWLALERLIYRDIVPDFPVCNKSINGSYSGCDL